MTSDSDLTAEAATPATAGPVATGAEPETPAGLERLVFFSDAVVAIAITLVVLPLVDNARELDGGSAWDFLRQNRPDLVSAGVSFWVIAAFWFDHHALFERATQRVPRLMQVNMAWLAGIVVLPVATVVEVRSGHGDRGAFGLYVGTIMFLMVIARLQETLLARAGALTVGERGLRRAIDEGIPVVVVLIALVIGLINPYLSTSPLLLLVLSRPLRVLAGRVFGYRAKP